MIIVLLVNSYNNIKCQGNHLLLFSSSHIVLTSRLLKKRIDFLCCSFFSAINGNLVICFTILYYPIAIATTILPLNDALFRQFHGHRLYRSL